MKMLSGAAPTSLLRECRNWKSPAFSVSDLLWVQTRYSAEPGGYSHLKTAFPHSDVNLGVSCGASLRALPAAGAPDSSGNPRLSLRCLSTQQ